jgi:bifunctional UDP-N-acetylglucosamine pyrophosphorylase/glucosamine-1-phosphate N-acetyltransferase
MGQVSMRETGAIILAAGMGTRMRTALPKVLHPLGGQPMLGHLLDQLKGANLSLCVVVVGAGAEAVKAAMPDVSFVVQEPQLGTGHAVLSAREAYADFEGDLIVLYGDVPLLQQQTVAAMLAAVGADASADLVVLGFRAADPSGYGRLIVDSDGGLARIIEERDAGPEDREIDLCNSGAMAGDADMIFEFLEAVGDNNAKGEYYLTDIVGMAREKGKRIKVIEAQEDEVMGVNSLADLAEAEAKFQSKRRSEAMKDGVMLVDPESVYFAHDTEIAADVTIGPHVVFGTGVKVEEGARIEAFCHLDGCHIGEGAIIGPFARLRPGTRIGPSAKIGNFVELKKAVMHKGAKANHLAYIGDAEVGEGTNIGAGTITCNYDGVDKHRTKIGKNVLIGSNSALVAPLKIGDGVIVGAGSVISADIEDNALAMERAELTVKKGWAKTFWQKKTAAKDKKD